MQHDEVMAVLNDPLAQELIGSRIPARMAYVGTDGYPRVVPVGFHWDGQRFAVGTATIAPKVRQLTANPKVALTVDTEGQPPQVLLVRGTATIDIVKGVPDEFLDASRKGIPAEGWDQFEATVRTMYEQMALIWITPEWAKLLDFETRLPQAVHQLATQRGLAPPQA